MDGRPNSWIQTLLSRFPKPAARWSRLLGLAIIVGVLGGLSAEALDSAIKHGSALLVGRIADLGGPTVLRFDPLILFLPMAGGLVSGLLVYWLGKANYGHGTDTLIHAFHQRSGDLPLREPLVKAVANVAVLSSGGSTGPEAPTAALGAAIGSTIGKLFRLTARERRIMLVTGCAAGVGAIFKCPLGGALFATSVLYSEEEFEAEAMVPSFVASVIGYSTLLSIQGFGVSEYLLQNANELKFNTFAELIPYAVLGLLCGLTSILFNGCLRFVEYSIVPTSRLPRWFAPAMGGLCTGAIACFLPQVLDGRYDFIRNAMQNFGGQTTLSLWQLAGLFAADVLAKRFAPATTVGRGGSGGALGPSVFIGGIVGAFLGVTIDALFPGVFPPEYRLRESLIAVGMGGVLAATMRTPLAAIVMVTEMTGSLGLIAPSMLVCMSAYVFGRRYGFSHEQIRTAAGSPAHAGDAVIHMLEAWSVADVMETDWRETITPSTPLREMIQRMRPGTRPVFAVVDDGRLAGLVSVTDIRRIMEEPGLAEVVIAADLMTENLTVVNVDDDAYEGMEVLRRSNHTVLPVVSNDGKRRWLGMLTRERVFERVQENLSRMQKVMLSEHVGLSAIGQEAQLQQLVLGFAAVGKDRIQRLLVPMDAVGKSLRDTDFRQLYGAQVIAVEQPDGSIQCPPDIDMPMQSSHRLVAIVLEGSTKKS